jgi:hypothetical protein
MGPSLSRKRQWDQREGVKSVTRALFTSLGAEGQDQKNHKIGHGD